MEKCTIARRAKPQFSYSVVLDGKTPIDFEYAAGA
jgi:hypothetical protein